MAGFDYGLMKMRKEQAVQSGRGLRTMQQQAFNSVPANTALRRATKQPRGERPETAEKRERRALYGKFDPAKGICPECHMILSASGACTGFCE